MKHVICFNLPSRSSYPSCRRCLPEGAYYDTCMLCLCASTITLLTSVRKSSTESTEAIIISPIFALLTLRDTMLKQTSKILHTIELHRSCRVMLGQEIQVDLHTEIATLNNKHQCGRRNYLSTQTLPKRKS